MTHPREIGARRSPLLSGATIDVPPLVRADLAKSKGARPHRMGSSVSFCADKQSTLEDGPIVELPSVELGSAAFGFLMNLAAARARPCGVAMLSGCRHKGS
jgi:hypothetical protein